MRDTECSLFGPLVLNVTWIRLTTNNWFAIFMVESLGKYESFWNLLLTVCLIHFSFPEQFAIRNNQISLYFLEGRRHKSTCHQSKLSIVPPIVPLKLWLHSPPWRSHTHTRTKCQVQIIAANFRDIASVLKQCLCMQMWLFKLSKKCISALRKA